MSNITDGVIVSATDFPRTVMAQDDTVQLDLLNTSYLQGNPDVGVWFVAPTSGRVLITVGGGGRDNTNDNGIYLAPQVVYDDAVTVFLAPDVESYGYKTSGAASDYVFGSRTSLLDGLTPGRKYFARVMQAADNVTSPSADITMREIIVEPVS